VAKGTSTFVGRFHCAQGSWLVSTGSTDVAAALGRLFDARSATQAVDGADTFEMLPRSTSVRVVISGPDSIKAGLLTAAPRYDPKPCIRVVFRLADAYSLGGFRLSSASWDLAECVPALRAALAEVDDDAFCQLTAEKVEFVTRDGASLSYCRPSIKVIGPWHNHDPNTA
jgi:hypothetical protein